MEAVNRQGFLLINGLAGGVLFNALNRIVAVGAPYLCAAILVVVFLRVDRGRALFGLYSGLLGLLINAVITLIYFHPRPFMVGLGRTLLAHGPETSFPSDHATLAFSVALSFLCVKDLRVGIPLLLLALFSGFSRVYTGLHFPLDIVGSFGVSLMAAMVVIAMRKPVDRLNRRLSGLLDELLGAVVKKNTR
jgi:undecaprenyl-diphosphatase